MPWPGEPNAEEIEPLPRWAMVALAGRCARRVLPLYALASPYVSPEQIKTMQDAVELVERAAALGGGDFQVAWRLFYAACPSAVNQFGSAIAAAVEVVYETRRLDRANKVCHLITVGSRHSEFCHL